MKSKSLWLVGLIIIVTASFINGLLINQGIGGLLRESTRLVILIGIGLFIFGLIQKIGKK